MTPELIWRVLAPPVDDSTGAEVVLEPTGLPSVELEASAVVVMEVVPTEVARVVLLPTGYGAGALLVTGAVVYSTGAVVALTTGLV